MAAVSRKRLKLIIILLLILNFVCLLSYFINHPIPVNVHFHLHRDYLTHHHSSTTTTTTTDNLTSQTHLSNPSNYISLSKSHSRLKPWPVLLSYLPWDPAPDLRHGSCEAYFGNGFTRVVDILRRQSPSDTRRKFGFPITAGTSGGWFRCHYSDTLRSSICEGGRIRMDPSKIRMSKGGERIQEVIGRKDDDELPSFEPGAFWVDGGEGLKEKKKLVKEDDLDQFVSEGEILKHTMRELIDSIEIVGGSEFECSEWIEEPTLLVTRFEYANVFHTYTDWYSAYVSSRVTGLPGRPNVVFVDGHSKTQLEETWEALFSSIRFAKKFSGPVCFRHAVLSPLGYETAWFKGLSESIDCFGTSAKDLWANPNDQKTARLSEFGEMIKAAFGFQAVRHPIKKSNSSINVLFVRREDYLAHPRHRGKVESRLSNELEVFESLNTWAANFSECKINLMNGLFAHMSMKEQLRAIQDASVVIGAHGAGLTHTVSALPKTAILEIIASQYRRPHFQLIAQWKGLEYHAINLGGDYAEPAEVIDRLGGILKNAGC